MHFTLGQALPLDVRFFLDGGSIGSEEPSPGATLSFLLYNRPEEIPEDIPVSFFLRSLRCSTRRKRLSEESSLN